MVTAAAQLLPPACLPARRVGGLTRQARPSDTSMESRVVTHRGLTVVVWQVWELQYWESGAEWRGGGGGKGGRGGV